MPIPLIRMRPGLEFQIGLTSKPNCVRLAVSLKAKLWTIGFFMLKAQIKIGGLDIPRY